MTGQTITINGPDGAFSGYLAAPASGTGPGIVVMQEIFGVNQAMRDAADGWAALGYFVLVPDLFWRLEANVQLTDKSEGEINQALGYLQRYDIDRGMADIQTAITHLRTLPGVSGKVGAVGYCLGGLYAFLGAGRLDADALVGYYGIQIQNRLDEAAAIKKPLMLHFAGSDQLITPEGQENINKTLEPNPLVTLHIYPGMHHGFARVNGIHYDRAAADIANSRTATFLKQHLG